MPEDHPLHVHEMPVEHGHDHEHLGHSHEHGCCDDPNHHHAQSHIDRGEHHHHVTPERPQPVPPSPNVIAQLEAVMATVAPASPEEPKVIINIPHEETPTHKAPPIEPVSVSPESVPQHIEFDPEYDAESVVIAASELPNGRDLLQPQKPAVKPPVELDPFIGKHIASEPHQESIPTPTTLVTPAQEVHEAFLESPTTSEIAVAQIEVPEPDIFNSVMEHWQPPETTTEPILPIPIEPAATEALVAPLHTTDTIDIVDNADIAVIEIAPEQPSEVVPVSETISEIISSIDAQPLRELEPHITAVIRQIAPEQLPAVHEFIAANDEAACIAMLERLFELTKAGIYREAASDNLVSTDDTTPTRFDLIGRFVLGLLIPLLPAR